MNLAEIRINTCSLTEEELNALNEIVSGENPVRFKNLKDFKLRSHDDAYKKDDEAHNEHVAKERYQKYMSEDKRVIITEWGGYICDVPTLMQRLPNITFDVQRVMKIKGASESESSLSSYIGKFETLQEKASKSIDRLSQFNEKVNVHVGNSLLMTINETLIETDCCTEQLDRHLDNGWRILAVCVQPDQRRPDYVLGRYNPNKH